MTREAYLHQIQGLRDDVVAMSSMVDKAIARSIEALRTQDIDLAREVWPGQSPSLNQILKRLGMFDEERAKKHGALIDSRLLAGGFVRMLDLRDQPRVQSELLLTGATSREAAVAPLASRPPRPIKAI